MVLHFDFDDGITGSLVDLVGSVGVHVYFKCIRIPYISDGGDDLLDPVAPGLQVVGQDQPAVLIREIGLMGLYGRIRRDLLHICICINVKNFEFRTRNEDVLLCFIILLDDPELCLKLIIEQDTPLLRRSRMILRDGHFEIIDGCEVMGCRGLADNIFPVRDRDGNGISLLIREHLRLAVGGQHDWLRSGEIIAAVRLCLQRTDQVSGESHALQQVRVGLVIISCLDHLERLLDDLFFGSAGLRDCLHKVSLIGTVDVILRLIEEIALGRDQLLDEIFPEIQVFHKGFSVSVCRHGRNLAACLKQDSGLSIGMDDVLTGKKPIGRFDELRITLRCAGLLVHLGKVDPGVNTLINKSVAKSDFRLFLVGVIEGKTESICLVPYIILRSLDLFYIIAVVYRKVRLKNCASIRSCRGFFDECVFGHNDFAVCGLDVSPGIKPEDPS